MTGQDVMDYIAIRQYRDKISKSYAGNIQKCLSAFVKWAYRKHHIDKDIYWDIDKIKIPQKRKKRLSDYEVSKCKNTLKTLREKALLELMLSAGRVWEKSATSKLKIWTLNEVKSRYTEKRAVNGVLVS